jgi:hypothetical protein
VITSEYAYDCGTALFKWTNFKNLPFFPLFVQTTVAALKQEDKYSFIVEEGLDDDDILLVSKRDFVRLWDTDTKKKRLHAVSFYDQVHAYEAGARR